MLDINAYNQRALVSQKFIDTIILVSRQQRKSLKQIGAEYGWNQSGFSQILNHHTTVTKNDSRVVRLVEDLGLNPDECFE